MGNKITKLTLWATELEDKPGAVAEKMQILAEAGANLEFVTARRRPELPGKGILFVSPIKGKRQEEAARRAYFTVSSEITALRIEGINKAGLGHRITHTVSDLGVNLRGLMASVMGKKFTLFLAFDSMTDAERSLKVLRKIA